MKDYSLLQFITTPLVLSEKIRSRVFKYLIAVFILAILLEVYIYFTADKIEIMPVILFINMALILMPFIVYIFLPIQRKIDKVIRKKAPDTTVHYWLLSKKFFHLMVMFFMYIWLAIVLLAVSMCIVAL
jgi:hypothetical protein